MNYDNEFPKIAKLDVVQIMNDARAEQILEIIKDTSVEGKQDRGYPKSVEIKDIVRYTTKNEKYICEGPEKLESHPDFLDDLVKTNGILCRETKGKIYWLSTTKPNSSMSDPVTGVSTGFEYVVDNTGSEYLYIDAICFGATPSFASRELIKVSNSGLRKIVQAMNPNSKLL